MNFLFTLLLAFSGSAFARQYIQCGDAESYNSAVINLNGDKSTLYMTNGVHLPDEENVLKKIYYVSTNNEVTMYETQDGDSKQTIAIPTNVIGKRSNNFDITFYIESSGGNYPYTMSCFSAIYEE